ncbi:hypothetical protein PpBr36_06949, partial [Pyricularia pennisetigena]
MAAARYRYCTSGKVPKRFTARSWPARLGGACEVLSMAKVEWG